MNATTRTTALAMLCLAHAIAPLPAQTTDEKPGTAPAPVDVKNRWFEVTEQDLGTFLEGETATGTFRFRNPDSDTAHQLQYFQPSCTCAKTIIRVGDRRYELANEPKPNSIYRITSENGSERELVDHVAVAGGESGSIEVQLNLQGVQGAKEATVTFQTTDEQMRFASLKSHARATTFFAITPSEINLNKMSWKDQRDFTCQVTSPIQQDFEITGHDPLPPKMTVEYQKELRDGRAVWTVSGTYGPNVDPNAGGGIVNLHTNVQDKKVQVRVMAWVEGPLNFRPGGFLPLGMIRANEGAERVVEIEPTDDFDLQVDSVELKNLSIPEQFVHVTSEKDGKILKVRLAISRDVPRRLVRGDLIVHLNHPAARTKEFQFNGFVR